MLKFKENRIPCLNMENTTIPCFLTVIGEALHPCFHQKILKRFEDLDYCNPENEGGIKDVIQKMYEKSVAAQAVAILIINGHGNNDEDILFTFPKLKIKGKYIYNCLKQSKLIDPSFKCVVLMETCFSGNFAKLGKSLCCDTLITSTDGLHVSRNNLLIGAFNEVLQDSEYFTPNKIFSNANDNKDDSWEKKSDTVKMMDCWDFSSLNEDIAKKHNLSKEVFKECYPQKFGNVDILLKPVISANVMNEVVKKTIDNKQLSTSENLHKNLLEMTNQSHSFPDFFAAMTLRQFKCNCIIKPYISK